jgi:hypothetical protein
VATVEIPIPPIVNSAGSARFRVALDGDDFVLTLQWNQRTETWSLDVADVNEDAIVSGIVLVPTWDLLGLVTDSRAPRGSLMLWQPDGGQDGPTLTGLGTSSRLVYYEAG